MSDSGIPVATLRQMATGQLLRVVHTILTIIAEQVEANPPVRGEEAPGTPPGLFGGPTLLGSPGTPDADGPCVDADWDSRLAEHIFPGDILSYPSANEVTLWVNGILDRLIANRQPGFTSQGLKATMLSWASKAGGDEYDRHVLGGHSMKGRQRMREIL